MASLTLQSPLVLTHSLHRTGHGAVLLSVTVENRSDQQLVLNNQRLIMKDGIGVDGDKVTLTPVFNKTKSVENFHKILYICQA